jgi:hypothetical protein
MKKNFEERVEEKLDETLRLLTLLADRQGLCSCFAETDWCQVHGDMSHRPWLGGNSCTCPVDTGGNKVHDYNCHVRRG